MPHEPTRPPTQPGPRPVPAPIPGVPNCPNTGLRSFFDVFISLHAHLGAMNTVLGELEKQKEELRAKIKACNESYTILLDQMDQKIDWLKCMKEQLEASLP